MKTYTAKTLDEALKNIAASNQCEIEDIVYNVIEEKNNKIEIDGGIGSINIDFQEKNR